MGDVACVRAASAQHFKPTVAAARLYEQEPRQAHTFNMHQTVNAGHLLVLYIHRFTLIVHARCQKGYRARKLLFTGRTQYRVWCIPYRVESPLHISYGSMWVVQHVSRCGAGQFGVLSARERELRVCACCPGPRPRETHACRCVGRVCLALDQAGARTVFLRDRQQPSK